MEDRGGACRVLGGGGELEGKRLLERPGPRWENNTKMTQEIKWRYGQD
jgi:hypothetical protein